MVRDQKRCCNAQDSSPGNWHLPKHRHGPRLRNPAWSNYHSLPLHMHLHGYLFNMPVTSPGAKNLSVWFIPVPECWHKRSVNTEWVNTSAKVA